MNSPMRLCTVFLMLFAIGCGKPEGSTFENKHNLKLIALQFYEFQGQMDSKNHNRGPSSAAEFLSTAQYDVPYVDPMCRKVVESGQYIFIWDYNLADDRLRNESTILAYHTSVPKSGGYALYADGSVKIITSEQFASAVIATADAKTTAE
jgi:hypothetical protein